MATGRLAAANPSSLFPYAGWTFVTAAVGAFAMAAAALAAFVVGEIGGATGDRLSFAFLCLTMAAGGVAAAAPIVGQGLCVAAVASMVQTFEAARDQALARVACALEATSLAATAVGVVLSMRMRLDTARVVLVAAMLLAAGAAALVAPLARRTPGLVRGARRAGVYATFAATVWTLGAALEFALHATGTASLLAPYGAAVLAGLLLAGAGRNLAPADGA